MNFYTLIMWARETKDETDLVMRLLDRLEQFDPSRLLRFYHGKPFTPTRESIAALIQKNWDKQFPDLGANILYLTSSLLEDELIAVGLGIGKSSPMFVNTLTVQFPDDLLVDSAAGRRYSVEAMRSLFEDCVRIFRPFWGEVETLQQQYRDEDSKIHQRVDREQVPTRFHWFNYFGPEMVENLGGMEKILSAPGYSAYAFGEGGAILMLLNEPFDNENPDHLQLQNRVAKHFDLARLHEKFLDRPPPAPTGKKPKFAPLEDASEENVAELGTAAERCVEDMKEHFGVELDWSEESIEKLDEVISAQWGTVEEPDEGLILNIGSYLGEVIVRQLGGKWKVSQNGHQYAYSDRVVMNVFGKVRKRLVYGEGEGLAWFYEVMKGQALRNREILA